MNRNLYRLVFNAARGMLVAVPECATGCGKGRQAGLRSVAEIARSGCIARFAVPPIALAVWIAAGLPCAQAQVIGDPNSGANRPTVVQTANGLQQVNITRPSAAGVSTNAYTQFDVPRPGVILNNAPTPVSTQQAGYINGNPNLVPGGSARIIVNQVTGTSPSQLQGYVEVAGPRSEVVIANPNGLMVNGLGFINTSRATLTTGTPVFGGAGSLDAFRVTGGQIVVQGDGMNAANVDQVDLIARAVQANAVLYANQLNVIAGANQVDRQTLAATPIAGAGPAPALGIDVGELGGMYANKIILASTENGVGVSLRGMQAAQAGDLTLTAHGQLILGGQTNASGRIVAYARDGFDNSGTTYAKGAASINTDGTLSNSGTLAAQYWLNAYGGTVRSTGTLAAGLNDDGTAASPADLAVVATAGAVTATGRNIASGNATIQGTSANLAGSQTSAGGNLDLGASTGNLDLTGATTSAGAGLVSAAAGALINDRGNLSSGAATSLTAASVSNQAGQIVSQGVTKLQTTGAINNMQGVVQSGGALNAGGASLDNTAGRITSLNGEGLSIQVSGALVNAAGTTANCAEGGVIGGNGNVQLVAGAMTNSGQVSAAVDADINAASLNNDTGRLTAGGALATMVAGAMSNRQGTVSAANTSLSAKSLDNTGGHIEGGQLAIRTTGDLINRDGAMSQFGETDATITAGGALDNTSGNITANGQNLTVQAGTLVNDSGSISHAGTGILAVTSQGAASNAGGTIQTNGDLQAQAITLNNTQGVLSAQRAATVRTSGDLLNQQGALYGKAGLTVTSGGGLDNMAGSAQTGGDLSVTAAGALTNVDGTIAANGEHGQATVAAASVDNTRGYIANAGDGATTVTGTTALTNTAGQVGGNGDVTLNTQALTNTSDGTAGGFVAAGGALNLNIAHQVDNRQGTLYGGNGLTLDSPNATFVNDGGQALGRSDVSLKVASVTNASGTIKANQDIAVQGAVSGSGDMIAGRNLVLDVAGDYTNDAVNRLHADGDMRVSATGTFTNTATLAAAGALTASGAKVVNAASATINSSDTTVTATESIDNAGRIEGDTVQTNSPTMNNTGTVIGNNVTVKATDISNTGAEALMAAVQNLNVYATNSVRNLDGATLYSAGNLQIARDGTRDPATGLLANQVTTLINRSATIEAEGDIDIAANQVSNTRTSIVTAPGTPVTSASQTLTMWNAGMTGPDLNFHESVTFPSWRWSGESASVSASRTLALMQPVTVTVDKSTVSNLNPSTQTIAFTQSPVEEYFDASSRVICSDCPPPTALTRNLTSNATQYYQSITDNGSTYSITFWPEYDPAKHIRPDQVRMRYDLGPDSHDYSEISRTTTTTTTTDQLVSATDPAKLQAGGSIRINSAGGSILNQSSIMAAGGDLIRVAPNGGVHDIGTALQQTVSTTDTSTFYWHQKTGSNSDTQQVVNPTTPQAPTTVMALPAVVSAKQAVQTTAHTITVATVNREGQTVTGSGGNLSGGGATGTQVAGATGGAGKAPQTLGTASGGIPNLSLPTNGLYHYQTVPGATYLIATDPRFTQYTKFISSDYMLGQLGLDPAMTQKRLGDGFYEQKLIRDQATQLTGRTYLAGYSDQLAEYQALMDAGVLYAKTFHLAPGIGLSEAQTAQLTTDMVWLVSQDVTLPDGSHQTVLVPKLYLAQSHSVDLQHTGALVTGNQVNLNATGDLANSGRIVGDVATQVVGNNIVNRGQIGNAGTTVVKAQQDVRNLGGRITGTDTLVSAGRDVINETQTISNQVTMGNHSAGATGIGAVAAITATNNVGVLAGRDINMAGGVVGAGNNALLGAGRDLHLGTVATGTTQDSSSRGGQSHYHDQTTVNVGSSVQAGNNVVAVAGRDATLTGSAIEAGGNASLVAGRNTTVTAAVDTHTHREGSLGGKGAEYTKSSYDEAVSGSSVHGGNNANLAAGEAATVKSVLQANGITASTDSNGTGNLAVLGSSATTDKGAANLIATGDVTVGTVNEKHTAQDWSQTKHSGFLSKEQTTKESSQQQTVSVGSLLSADSVTVSAGRDLTVSGSTVVATKDVNLDAGRDLTIGSAKNTSASHSYEHTTKSGLGATGSGFSYGKRDQKDTINDSAVTQTGSLVGSTDGSVHLNAGNALKVSGSDLIAAKDVTGVGADVTIEAAKGTRHHDETHEVKQSGFTLGVSGGAIGAALNAGNKLNAAGRSEDGRASALWGVAAARDAFDAGSALAGGASPATGAAVTLSWGSSQIKQTLTEDSTSHTGSRVQAGGTAAFIATGVDANGNKTAGNLNIIGSDIDANKVALGAKHDINIVSATDTDESHSTNKSSSASVGVSYGAQGFGVSASASKAKGNADSEGSTQVNSHVTGKESVTFVSGHDTNLLGATLSGGKVVGDVGGNLNIASRQDTEESHARQQSMGGGFSISQGGGSASVSASKGKADGSYANVSEQSRIYAGADGFDINVKGNTDLKGAVIASDAGKDKNSLTTGTLTWSDIKNRSDYSATSMGVSAGGAMGSPSGQSNSGPTSGKNTGGINPMIPQHKSGSEDGMAQAAVAEGTIRITDGANQQQDLATLQRDTSNTNTQVASNPDLDNLLNKQADMMAAAQAAGEAVAKTVGDVAGAKLKEAQANERQAREAGDLELAAKYDAEAKQWEDGGSYRAALHSAGGALIAGLGGGNALAGAAGAGLGSLAGGKLNELSSAVAKGANTGNADVNETLGNLAANIAAGGIGGIVGGAGAATAANVDRYNRQLHPDEKAKIRQQANGDKAAEERLTKAACYEVKCWAEYPVGSDAYSKNYVSAVEASQLTQEREWVHRQQEANLFVYTPLQKASDALRSDPVGVAKDATKVLLGGVTTKTGVALCTSGIGCAAGAPMAAFGASDVAEGADGLYNRYNGINSPGTNPLRYGFNLLSPIWGDLAYDGLNLAAAASAMRAPVPLKMGMADGLNRSGSIFGVTVPRINNNTLIPFTGLTAPYGTTQAILLFGVGAKGAEVINDMRNTGDKK
ncbi:filamentous hemagglutinin N-terminal domain-containing protein [Cupriavidus necator]|uniref:hemagglutinin repeat-containing protein n=1 Tax=Cupriavidus necator TaxID=106590 RepID=UPI0014902E3F|nr:hemagglutinin repeat-containing protein [Cupriavidus necator]NOV26566.1 filamentous hemagglutinin N-terminal domain-containing protein [Cupriavidus necator]